MKIDSNFDGGNIEVIDTANANSIRLNIRNDMNSDHRQWFYFRASNIKDLHCKYFIENAAEASYPEAWDTCTIVASSDRKTWRRIITKYDGKVLSFSDNSDKAIIYYALFAPYSNERHMDLIAQSLEHPQCFLLKTIKTVNKNQIEVLRIGEPSSRKKSIWIIARQHPAETMSEWFMEGFLYQLLKEDVVQILTESTFYIVANMNPDGAIVGNLRTNSSGIDLNRSWKNPCPQKSPESYFVFDLMKETGVDLFLDIHGDEDTPFTFIAGCEGNPGYSERMASLDQRFREYYQQATPEFAIENGYPADLPNQGDLDIACNQIGCVFGCLSLTIELPFLDNKYQPEPIYGWSPQRSIDLGAKLITPIKRILPCL
jgi:murein tripeptide amidase MpaA